MHDDGQVSTRKVVCFRGGCRDQGCPMCFPLLLTFDVRHSVFFPPASGQSKAPVLYYLSGLSCTDRNAIEKVRFLKHSLPPYCNELLCAAECVAAYLAPSSALLQGYAEAAIPQCTLRLLRYALRLAEFLSQTVGCRMLCAEWTAEESCWTRHCGCVSGHEPSRLEHCWGRR